MKLTLGLVAAAAALGLGDGKLLRETSKAVVKLPEVSSDQVALVALILVLLSCHRGFVFQLLT